jgi:hypothetical protein
MNLLIALVVAGLAVLIALLVAARSVTRNRTQAAWEELAQLVEGRFVPAGGPWSQPTPPLVECIVEDLTIVLDSYVASAGRAAIQYTRARVEVPTVGDRTVKISREGVLASLGKLFGTQDVQVGDARYDDTFLLKASDPEWLQGHLEGHFRELHLHRPDVFIVLEDGQLSAAKMGIDRDPAKLRGQIELVAACAKSLAGARKAA